MGHIFYIQTFTATHRSNNRYKHKNNKKTKIKKHTHTHHKKTVVDYLLFGPNQALVCHKYLMYRQMYCPSLTLTLNNVAILPANGCCHCVAPGRVPVTWVPAVILWNHIVAEMKMLDYKIYPIIETLFFTFVIELYDQLHNIRILLGFPYYSILKIQITYRVKEYIIIK